MILQQLLGPVDETPPNRGQCQAMRALSHKQVQPVLGFDSPQRGADRGLRDAQVIGGGEVRLGDPVRLA